jgi:hypothetical protein
MSVLKTVEDVAVDVADAVLQVAVTSGAILAEGALDNATGVDVEPVAGGIDVTVGAKPKK